MDIAIPFVLGLKASLMRIVLLSYDFSLSRFLLHIQLVSLAAAKTQGSLVTFISSTTSMYS